jgi:hypothetical protein
MRPTRLALSIGLVTVAGFLIAGLPGCDTTQPPAAPAPLGNASAPTPVQATVPPTQAEPTPGPNPPSLAVRTNPDPPRGPIPLDVNFNACKSTDPDGDKLTFIYFFGDGKVKTLDFCRHDHVYQKPGLYFASVCASDGGRHTVCESITVNAQ